MKTHALPYSDWIEETKKKLDSLDETLTDFERRTRELRDDTAADLRARTVSARVTLDEWKGRWSEAKHTASSVWETVGEEIGTAWEAAKVGLDRSLEEIEEGLESLRDARTPEEGDTVFVHYTGKLEDGTEFQSTEGRDPIEFVLGGGAVIPGVEAAVRDLTIGERTTATIPVADGFGPRDEALVFRIPKERFPESEPPGLGDRATVRPPDAEPLVVTVRRIENDVVEVDANHPLAGHDLHMELQLVGIA